MGVICSTKFTWQSVTCDVPWSLILRSAWLDVFISLDDGEESSLTEFVDAAKLGKVVGRGEGKASAQRDLHLGQNNSMQYSWLGAGWLESSAAEKIWGVLDNKLKRKKLALCSR